MKRWWIVLIVLAVLAVGLGSTAAQSGNSWRIDFYSNTNWVGLPVFSAASNFINFNWGAGSPGPNVPADNFSARMTTSAYFYPGLYTFTVVADDDFVLYVNGATLLNTVRAGQSGKSFSTAVYLNQGYASIQVDYVEYTANAYISVNWFYNSTTTGAQDGGGTGGIGGIIPTATPIPQPPPSQTSVETIYGNYTPCIQQRSHQANCFVSNGAWNAPNVGSIQGEPQILIWRSCVPDSVDNMVLYAGRSPQRAKCSKTGAGFFPG